MKRKIVNVLKGVFFVALFCTIYAGSTILTESKKAEAIYGLEANTNLDTLVNDLIAESFTDSLTITNYDGYSAAIDSLEDGSYKPIKQFLYDRCIDTSNVKKFKGKLETIVNSYHEDLAELKEYKLEHENLITRWPSNMIVGDVKSLNK